ncbi:MAG: hypothetical protein IJ158_12405 [Treponema sp.]|nr:hypothetical protein [Treponema sp.]
MRLARRFRPLSSNKTTRANSKKNSKRLAANYALLASLAASTSKSKK